MLTKSHWKADTSTDLLEWTVGDVLRDAAANVPDRVALIDATPDPRDRRHWTFAELLADAEKVARALLGRFTPGERIAIWAANCPEWVVFQQGASLAGMTLVTVNPALKEHELRHVLGSSNSVGILVADSYRGYEMRAAVERLRPELPALREIIPLDDWDDFIESGDPDAVLPTVRPSDPVQIQYTSGTTGFAKAALLHHRGVVNASRFVADGAGVKDAPVWVNSMPMFHIGGGALTEIGAYTHRGTFVLLRAFDAALQLEVLETYGGTITLAVPTMLIEMLDHPDAKVRDLSALSTVMSGASVVPAELVRRTKDQFGCDFSIVFGQTEMHGVISQTALSDSAKDQSETIGSPLPHAEVRIADPSTGETVPVGQAGEIQVRGYQTLLEYAGDPAATAAALESDGWLHSGDLGAMDERGYLEIIGRLKDVIIRGGENIYPREVEDIIFSHPAVSQVAVFGLPDEHWGEIVAAAIKVQDGVETPDENELREYVRSRLARYKAPARWFFVDQFPLTTSGKIQKFVLQSEFGSADPQPVSS